MVIHKFSDACSRAVEKHAVVGGTGNFLRNSWTMLFNLAESSNIHGSSTAHQFMTSASQLHSPLPNSMLRFPTPCPASQFHSPLPSYASELHSPLPNSMPGFPTPCSASRGVLDQRITLPPFSSVIIGREPALLLLSVDALLLLLPRFPRSLAKLWVVSLALAFNRFFLESLGTPLENELLRLPHTTSPGIRSFGASALRASPNDEIACSIAPLPFDRIPSGNFWLGVSCFS